MRITKAAENSILILYHLAKRREKLTAAELAKTLSTPINHLYKLVQALSRGGYVKTSQGKTGGIRLAKVPQKIALLEIVELLEGPIRVSNCFLGEKTCALIKNCALKCKLEEARNKFTAVLHSSTIKDLLRG